MNTPISFLGIGMDDTASVIELLQAIRQIGVQISIDDFGTDYSSLSRLKMLPIDKIKIDKQFIDGISSDAKDRGIIQSIMDLSKKLGLKVIAEGVEDEHQLNYLKEQNCTTIQGYYYYRPMSSEDIEELLQK
ncbi:MAG: EAL domain-containing protein [Clostridia bacterium]|nr:EAL domain-containing protein [Clostridia bacterium]